MTNVTGATVSYTPGQIAEKLWLNEVSKGDLKTSDLPTLQAATLKTSVSAAGLETSKMLLEFYVHAKTAEMTEGLEGPALAHFRDWAQAGLDMIFSSTFDQLASRLQDASSGESHSTLKEANAAAQDFLKLMEFKTTVAKGDALREKVQGEVQRGASQDVTPQVIRRGGNGEVTVIRKAPQIETLVLKGGGGKGLAYPAVLAEQERAGMLGGLKKVVGTSAGALTAVGVSVGLSSDELSGLASRDMKPLLETNHELGRVYPEIKYQNTAVITANTLGRMFGGGHGEANGMLALLDRTLGNKVADFLQAHAGMTGGLQELSQVIALATGDTPATVDRRLNELLVPDYNSDRTGSMVTFKDLAMLHAVAPNQFKEIELTGFDLNSEEGHIFNAATTPDMPVALAARVSMAHPMIAKGVVLTHPQTGESSTYADGGIASNSPVEAAYGGDRALASVGSGGDNELEMTHAKTLVMIFDEGGKAYSTLHSDTPEQRWTPPSGPKAFVERFISGNSNLGRDKVMDRVKENSAGPNAFVVFHGKLGTYTTKPDAMDFHMAKAIAAYKALEQIQFRIDGGAAVSQTFGSEQAMRDAFTADELAAYDQANGLN